MTSWTRGSIIQKPNGRWYVLTNHRDITGKRFQRWHGGYDNKRQANHALSHVIKDLGTGPVPAPNDMTVQEFFKDRWLPVKENTVRPSTHDSYRRMLENHLYPTLGHIAIQHLTPEQLTHLYQTLQLSAKSIRNLHGVIKTRLKDATVWNLIHINPAEHIQPPRIPRHEPQTWTTDQTNTFLTQTRDHEHNTLASRGHDRNAEGELLGLRWKDINFDK